MTTGEFSSTPLRTCSSLPLLRIGTTVAVYLPISSVLARFHLYYYSDNATSEDKETILMVDTQPEEAAVAVDGELDDPLGKVIQSK